MLNSSRLNSLFHIEDQCPQNEVEAPFKNIFKHEDVCMPGIRLNGFYTLGSDDCENQVGFIRGIDASVMCSMMHF